MRALGTRFFYTILLVVSLVKASPWPGYLKYSTHGLKMIGRDLKVDSYHPKTTYKTYGEGKEVASFVNGDLEKSTISFISSELGVDPSTIAYNSGHTADNDMSYAYAKQSYDGVPLANAVANVAFRNGKAVAFGTSFVDTSTIASSQPSITLDSIISKVEDAFDATYNGINSLEYLAQADGSVALTYVLQVQNTDTNAGYEAFVDAHSGNIVGSTDFLAEATYTVLPITKQSVLEGEETLVNPEDFQSSPIGWVQNGETAFETMSWPTRALRAVRTKESSSDTFDYPYDVSYGWTESAYNFQLDNFGKGGAGGDRVQMSVQDSSGYNNANFSDSSRVRPGQNGTCRMYVFTMTTPRRDGDLQNDIIVHEFTHGLTNRMTGGGTARCLQTYESAGMGEGWSDAMADWTEQKGGNITDFVTGTWVMNNTAGVRHYPYSTDAAVNPLRYSSLSSLYEVHDIGEVWANMLHNVHALLVEANGWSPTAMSDPSGSEGNIVYLHLFIDALALQPCNPTFVDARNAWIQADVNRYNGDHACTLWIAFASRGLGIDADHYIDDETIPYDC
ncbi:Fungalysin metallopeptidase-domain-containing protein [Desarmillaria tabescens]|uniref:Extracellular metalloproteinase n=1 Tax=Armillaria tabescens TaxID=1929756 RepID=A0AA39J903_ARMTA|nr:Fungalysin metallopeptidase-domain-containing protein [Desarmillaria tabescens]KAK0437607.1 Fungalysin metallopeptidase-domain-containing protein [Desarmillaria tabescens]